VARLELHLSEVAKVCPRDCCSTILHSAASMNSIPLQALNKIIDAFPEALLMPSGNNDTPVMFAIVNDCSQE